MHHAESLLTEEMTEAKTFDDLRAWRPSKLRRPHAKEIQKKPKNHETDLFPVRNQADLVRNQADFFGRFFQDDTLYF